MLACSRAQPRAGAPGFGQCACMHGGWVHRGAGRGDAPTACWAASAPAGSAPLRPTGSRPVTQKKTSTSSWVRSIQRPVSTYGMGCRRPVRQHDEHTKAPQVMWEHLALRAKRCAPNDLSLFVSSLRLLSARFGIKVSVLHPPDAAHFLRGRPRLDPMPDNRPRGSRAAPHSHSETTCALTPSLYIHSPHDTPIPYTNRNSPRPHGRWQ